MTSLPRAAPQELHIDTTATMVLLPIDTESELPAVEAAQLSPKTDRVRHHLIPARTSTCVRAPCLKRQASVPIPSIITDVASARRHSNHSQDRVASNPLPTSFAAPRNLVLQSSSRHVHFDEAPPEEFFVLSGESYDRRPIKCTQGGSEFDMSLPPRSTSYNGDESNDDDASAADDGSAPLEPADEPAPDVGFFHDPSLENWACIKNGTVIASVGYQPRQQQSGLMASGKSLHFSALSSLQHASALNGGADADTQELEPQSSSQKVSLPVHGFRSFGGLQNSLATKTTAVAMPSEQSATPKHIVSSPETTPPALRSYSPDATPMPSPSLHKSIGAFTSVGYFDTSLHGSSRQDDLSSSQATLRSENALGSMEILQDAPVPNLAAPDHDLCMAEPVSISNNGLSSPTSANPLAAVSVKLPETVAPSAPRRMGLERRMANKEAVRISSLHPPAYTHANGSASSPSWSGLLGISASPLSSRCSLVDPWSSLSSDGDGDGTDSPCNETSWISSNCTSPDLSSFEQVSADGFYHKAGPLAASGSSTSLLEARNLKHVNVAPALRNGAFDHANVSVESSDDLDHEIITPKNSGFADDAKFSSSVETVNTLSWDRKHVAVAAVSSAQSHGGISSGDVSASEATTPDSSRRPSFHHNDYISPRMRLSFGRDDDTLDMDNLDEDDAHVLRMRSLSRDGHAKKKSTKCRYCRTLRQRIKESSSESSAPMSSGGSAQITDAEEDAIGKASPVTSITMSQLQEHDDANMVFVSSTEVSEVEEEDGRPHSPLTQLRASVRSLSVEERSSNTSRSDSRDGSALVPGLVAITSQHDRESSNSPAESSSESPHLLTINTPMVCTCDKKREKERLKKKIRRERELERERDREWERDQAKGRQKKLFGESFGDADTSCLSALDGF